MVMAVDVAIMFIVAVLGSKNCRAKRASEMIDVVLSIQGSDVGPSQGSSTLITE